MFEEIFNDDWWVCREGFGRKDWVHRIKTMIVKYFTMSGDIMVDAVIDQKNIPDLMSALAKASKIKGLYIEKVIIHRVMIGGKEKYYVAVRFYNTKSAEWIGAKRAFMSVLQFIDFIMGIAEPLTEESAFVLMKTVFNFEIKK